MEKDGNVFDNLKYNTIKFGLKNFLGIELTNKGCEQLLNICAEIQKLIDIIKSGN